MNQDRFPNGGAYFPSLPQASPNISLHMTPVVGFGGIISELFGILNRNWLTLSAIALLGLAAGVGAALLQTPVYQAKSTLEIQELNGDFLNMKQVTPVGGFLNVQTDIQTQLRAVQSETLLRRSVERLRSQKAIAGGTRVPQPLWKTLLGQAPGAAPLSDQDLSMLVHNVKGRVIPQTRDFEILVDSNDPVVAAAYANEIAAAFIEQSIETRRELSNSTGQWLDDILREMRTKLEKSEAALQTYARSADLVISSDKKNLSEERLRQLQEELSKAQADRIEKQSRFEVAKQSPSESLPDVVNDQILRDYEARLTDLKRQRAEFSTTYAPGYSKLKRIEAEVATLDGAAELRRQKVLGRIQNDFETAQRREKALAAVHEAQAQEVARQSEKSIQYNILQREAEGNRQVYDATLKQAQEVAISAGMRASNIRVIDAAEPPAFAYKPRLVLQGVLGLIAGLFLGGVLAFARDSASTSIRQPGELGLSSAELGVILHNPDPKPRIPEMVSSPKMLFGANRMTLNPQKGDQSAMVADSFRGVLTSILFAARQAGTKQVFVITSPGPGEGKTSVLANLGVALAEVTNRVLLIDGDLRKPALHAMFGVGNEKGLVELLKCSAGTNPEEFIQQTQFPGLWVATAREEGADAFRLLQSARLQEVLADLKKRFDVIMIDAPPALFLPDARILGRYADGVIILTRAGKTTRDQARAACQQFESDGARILGNRAQRLAAAAPRARLLRVCK